MRKALYVMGISLMRFYCRELLLRFHRNRLLRFLLSFFYAGGLCGICLWLRTKKNIKGAYLRRGMTRVDWLPGASDYDLVLIVNDFFSKSEVQKFYQALRRMRYVFPIPIEALIFSESEWDRYFFEGGARCYEGKRSWKKLYGKISIPSGHETREAISLHCFSEAVDQYCRLTRILQRNRPLSRNDTRNGFKYFCDLLANVRSASTGQYHYFPSRLDSFSAFSQKWHQTWGEFWIPKIRAGYAPLSPDEWVQVLHWSIQILQETVKGLSWPTDEVLSEQTCSDISRPAIQQQLNFWQILANNARDEGLVIESFVHHYRLYVVAETSLCEPSAFSKMRVGLALLKKIRGQGNPLLVTTPLLRAISVTTFYQEYTLNQPGFSWRISGSSLPCWIKSRQTPEVILSLRAKSAIAPAEARLNVF